MSDFANLMEAARAAGVAINPPANSEVPMVSGNGVVGDVLTCTMGIWTGEPTGYAYAWMADGTPNDATAETYTVLAGDAGKSLSCVVTATNSAGSTAAPPSNAVLVAAAATRAAPEHTAEVPMGTRERPTAASGEHHRNRS